jgi:hypothetical protein
MHLQKYCSWDQYLFLPFFVYFDVSAEPNHTAVFKLDVDYRGTFLPFYTEAPVSPLTNLLIQFFKQSVNFNIWLFDLFLFKTQKYVEIIRRFLILRK